MNGIGRTGAVLCPAEHKQSPRRPRAHLPRQEGAVLLLTMLVLLITASYVLVNKLNAAAAQAFRDEQTATTLARAKQVLIGYAASYPDRLTVTDADAGPGFLPCPDTDNDGSSEASCGPVSDTVEIGRLPWKTLDLDNTKDAGGETLWYAVSGDFRSNPKTTPLNSETQGQLFLDGVGGVVAVLFAPGPSFSGQNRASDNAPDYLEGENGDDPPDINFASVAAGEFNDQVLAITRAELMAAVEKRVLGEFARVYERYRSDPDQDPSTPAPTSYPWLSPYSNPKSPTKMFDGTVGQREGQCFCDKDGDKFSANIVAMGFNIPGGEGSVTPSPSPIDESCLRNDMCTDKGCVFDAPPLNGTCDWTNRNQVKCQLSGTTPPCAGSGLIRTYEIGVDYTANPAVPGGGTVNVIPDTSVAVRTRDVTRGSSAGTPVTFTIKLTDNDGDTATLTLSGSSASTIAVSGIPYGLDTHGYPAPDPGPDIAELPQWVTSNDWHHLTYLAYATGDVPMPGDDIGSTPCTAGTDCLNVNYSGGGIDNTVRALVVSASKALAGQDRAGAGSLSDYFEFENQTVGDRIYQQHVMAPDFNDRVRVICRQAPCP